MEPAPEYELLVDHQALREKKQVEAFEHRAMTSLIKYPRVSEYFDFTRKHFEKPLEEIALLTSPDKRYLMDKYLPADILKMFNGLEIHNLSKAFSKFKDDISLEAFIAIGFRILDFPKEDSPYVLFGMMNLYYSLTIRKGKKTLSFREFLNNFIRTQSMFSEHKNFVSEETKTLRFFVSNIQDYSHHEKPIKNAFWSKTYKILFSLDEGGDHIQMFSSHMELKGKITMDKKHRAPHSVIIILDFVWSESQKKLAICSQDSSVSFFSADENFTKEEYHVTETLQHGIWYVDFCNYWFTTDTMHELFYWDSNHQQHQVTVRSRAKVSYVGEVSSLNLVAIATYDKKITLYNIAKHVIALVITQEDCSAHTLRYSKSQNLLFAATFGQLTRIYQVDKSRDYTKFGRLETFATTTALELLENSQMVLTCDDEGNLKSWDDNTFKTLQHHVLHSMSPVTKIVSMEDVGKFCVLTNRLNMFDIREVNTNQDKNTQIVPLLRYCPEKEEIIVAQNSDIRVFSLRYGILSELFDKELYNVDDNRRIVYFKRDNREDQTFFVDDRGFIKQLNVSTNPKANQGFQPFKTDNANFIYYEQDSLLVTWNRNMLMVYRYEAGTHTSLFLRSLKLPESCQMTTVKVYRSRGVLATVINHTLLIFWEFHKFIVCGVYTSFEEFIKTDLDESISTPLNLHNKTPAKSPFAFLSLHREPSKAGPTVTSKSLIPTRKKTLAVEGSNSKPSVSEIKIKSPPDSIVDDKLQQKPAVHNPMNEILDVLCVEGYNCCLLLDGKYELSLAELKGFEEFGLKIKLNLHSKIQSADYSYLKAKIKVIDFKPLIQEKAINIEEIRHLYVESKMNDGKDLQYLLFLTDSENRIIVMNLNEVLYKYFKPRTDDGKFKQPYYSSTFEFNEADMQELIEKAKNASKHNFMKPVFEVPKTKMTIWKTGENAILDTKVVIFNTLVIITLDQTSSINVWTIKGELKGQIFARDAKSAIWDINQYNIDQRIEVFQNTKNVFEKLYTRFEGEILAGCQAGLAYKFDIKIKQELAESEIKEEKTARTGKKKNTKSSKLPVVQEEDIISPEVKATLKARVILERDHHLLPKPKVNQDNNGEVLATPHPNPHITKKKEMKPEKQLMSELMSSYMQDLSKKLSESVDEAEEDIFDGTNRTNNNKKKSKKAISKSNFTKGDLDEKIVPSLEHLKLPAEVGVGLLSNKHLKKWNLNHSAKNEFDYIELYNQATKSEMTFSLNESHNNSRNISPFIGMPSLLEDSITKGGSTRAFKRSNFLKDLNSRKMKMKYSGSGADIKETLINLSNNIKDPEQTKMLAKFKANELGIGSLKSFHLPASNMDSFQSLNTAKQTLDTGKILKQYIGGRISQIERASLLPDISIDLKMLTDLNTSKDSSVLRDSISPDKKRIHLPALRYDPHVDEEIIQNMDNLEQLNKNMTYKAKTTLQKKKFLEFGSEIQQVKFDRKKGMQRHMLSGDYLDNSSTQRKEF